MPTKTVINRIGKVNFFAVLPSGFLLCLILFIAFQKTVDNEQSLRILWEQLADLANKPSIIILTLFASYILGSMIQVNSVYFTEYLTSHKLFRKETFPFPDMLTSHLACLNKHSQATKHDPEKTPDISDLSKDELIVTFNYWKDVLSMECPEAFDYYQSYEAQTRYYAGIYFTSLIGLLGGISLVIRAGMLFYYPGFILIVTSFVLLLAFGAQFQHVRQKEVKVLLYHYIAYLQR